MGDRDAHIGKLVIKKEEFVKLRSERNELEESNQRKQKRLDVIHAMFTNALAGDLKNKGYS